MSSPKLRILAATKGLVGFSARQRVLGSDLPQDLVPGEALGYAVNGVKFVFSVNN